VRPASQSSASESRRPFAALAAFFLIDGFVLANWATRIPAIKAGYRLSSGQLGVVLFAIAAGAAGSMLFTGALATRRGSLAAVRLATTIYLLAVACFVQLPGLWSLAAMASVFGAGFGAMNVALNAHAVALEASIGRPILARLHAAFSCGGLLGAASGGLAAAIGLAPRWQLPLVAGLGAIVAAAARHSLAAVDSRPIDAAVFARPQRGLVVLGVIAFCSTLGEGAASDWSGVFLHSSVGASMAVASLGYFAFSVAMAVGRLSGDWLVARYGATRPVRVAATVAAAALTAALVIRTSAVGIGGFFCLGVGLATVIPQTYRAAARTTALAPATGVAAVSTVGWLGFLAGPPVIGSLASVTSLPLALSTVAVAVVLIAALASRLELSPVSAADTDGAGRSMSTATFGYQSESASRLRGGIAQASPIHNSDRRGK
jgi:fucose permease